MPLKQVLVVSLVTMSAAQVFADAAADKARWTEYSTAIQPYSSALWQLDQVDTDGPNKTTTFESAPKTAAEILKVKALAAECSRYTTIKPPDGVKPYLAPARACDLAGRVDALAAEFVTLNATRYVTDRIDVKVRAIARLEQAGTLEEDSLNSVAFIPEERDAMTAKLTALYTTIGATVPADALKQLDDLPAKFDAAVAAGMPKTTLPASKAKDAALDKVVRAHFEKSTLRKRTYKVRRVWIGDAEWNIVAGKAAIPMRRTKTGHVLVQLDGEKFCRLYPLGFAQQYSGAGKYQAPGTVTVQPTVALAACK